VTALYPPEGLQAVEVVAAMRERGVILAGGQGEYEHTILRIGHMGFATEPDMLEVLQTLEDAIAQMREQEGDLTGVR
jgi:aspartate aminotransferase-like enzyme